MHLRFSHDIKALLERLSVEPLSLRSILSETSERGFSLVIGLLVLPFLLPMPPGLAGPLGAAVFILALQMALGQKTPWLPRRIAQFQFPNWLVQQLLNHLQRFTRLLEKWVRPRLPHIAESPYAWRLNGICIAWLSLLLIAPIPFTNPIPTTGILLLAIATLEADGLLMCVSYVLTLGITLVFGFFAYAILFAPNLLQDLFQ